MYIAVLLSFRNIIYRLLLASPLEMYSKINFVEFAWSYAEVGWKMTWDRPLFYALILTS